MAHFLIPFMATFHILVFLSILPIRPTRQAHCNSFISVIWVSAIHYFSFSLFSFFVLLIHISCQSLNPLILASSFDLQSTLYYLQFHQKLLYQKNHRECIVSFYFFGPRSLLFIQINNKINYQIINIVSIIIPILKFHMKVFKFPTTTICNQPHLKVQKLRHAKKQRIGSKSPKQSIMKKSNSMDLGDFQFKKMRELQKVYRLNSSDKKVRHKSVSTSKSTTDFKTSVKPAYFPYQARKHYTQLSGQKRIFLKCQKKQNQKDKFIYDQLRYCLEFLLEKLTKCLESKSENHFNEKYANALSFQLQPQEKQNSQQHLISVLVQTIQKCQQKKQQRKMDILKDRVVSLEKQKSSTSIEIKKMKIKQQVLNGQIKKLTDRYMQLACQLKKIRQRGYSHQGTQTIACSQKSCDVQTNGSKNLQNHFPKLIQQLRVFKQKQIHINILLNQLRKQGLNLQKYYKRGLKQKNKQIGLDQQNQGENSDLTSLYSPDPHIKNNVGKIEKQKRIISRKNDEECLADQSIIDEMDALSFNYCDKQNQMQAYTPRHIYICQKQLNEEMKKKLQLNFNCLYQQMSQNHADNESEGFPTI